VRLWLVFLGLLSILLVGSGPGAGASTPALPPQNGLIAISGVDGVQIVDPATGAVTSVPDTVDLGEPAWSPDASVLAVTEWSEDGPSVYTMKPDGSERRLLLDNGSSPSWSPDGERMVMVRDACFAGCTSDDEASELMTVDAEGNDVLELATIPGYVDSAEWSPDGKQIAFFVEDEVMLISADGAEDKARTIAKGPGVLVRSLSWSPDSSKIAFDRAQEGTQSSQVIVVLDLATGSETMLRGRQEGARAPVWSPDGKQLAFLSQSEATKGASVGCGEHLRSELWVMDTDGANARQLAKGDFYDAASWARALESAAENVDSTQPPEAVPPISRDTSTSTNKPETPATPPEAVPEEVPAVPPSTQAVPRGSIAVRDSNGIYLVDPATAAAHKVPDTADMIAPAWSPDGSLLAVERVTEAGVSSIYTIRPDGTDPRLVLKNATSPSWSAEGDLIYALRNECVEPCEPEDDAANVLFRVQPDGTGAQRVDLEEADIPGRELEWPPDGSAIGFFEDAKSSDPGSFDSSAAAWSPDWSQLAFIGTLGPSGEEDEAATAVSGLWIVAADGAPQLLLKGASGRPSWSTR
jgi:Tol biopolymer transport system component